MKQGIYAFIIVLMLAAGQAEAAVDPGRGFEFDFGFIASKQKNVLGETRITALGPLFEYVSSTNGNLYWGIRPFYARVALPERHKKRAFYLWPLGSSTRYLNELKWRALLAYGRIGNPGVSNSLAYRFSIFPFYYQSRDEAGKLAVALFPFGGTMQNFIIFDKLSFALFPLWLRWQSQDVVSQNFLWPLIASAESQNSNKIDRKRFLPFYAMSKKEGVYYKKSFMWPIWSWARYYGKAKGYIYVVWPLYGRVNRVGQKGWMFLPPFFRYQWGDATFIHSPWPFIQYSRSKYMKKLYLWPLWGKRTVGPLMNQFFLWPLIWDRTIDFDHQFVRGFQFIPFIIHDRMYTKNKDGTLGGVTIRHSKLWPLFSYNRKDTVRRTRLFEFWPFRENLGVAQTWAPLWTIFSHTVDTQKGFDTEILWGLYRQQREGTHRRYNSLFPLYSYERDDTINGGKKEWSFLKGLIGYKREHGIRRYRLLYFITFGGKRETH